MKTTQITYDMQRTAEQAFDSAKAQCDTALERADNIEIDDRLRTLMSTEPSRARLRSFLKTVQ